MRICAGATPAASAAVAPPMRNECAPNANGSRPTAAMQRRTASRTCDVVKETPRASQNSGPST
eukprot:4292050-Prymnesium_polylepis.1